MEKLMFRYTKELKKNGFDFLELISFADSVLFRKETPNLEIERIDFNKKYFCDNYYLVDKDTFNNWLKKWCPEIEISKEKRKFSKIEVDIILERFGKVNQSNFNSYNKKELIELLFEGEGLCKTSQYDKLEEIIDKLKLTVKLEKLNCFPPTISNQIIQFYFKENREKLNEIERLGRLREPKIAAAENMFKKALNMTKEERSDWTRVTTRRILYLLLKDMETDPQYAHLFKK